MVMRGVRDADVSSNDFRHAYNFTQYLSSFHWENRTGDTGALRRVSEQHSSA